MGPSVASDLYTVARTLAVLTFDFQGYTNVFADSLPDPEHIEVFSRYESFYRLLVRATDPDPGRRFSSAEEMGDQLTGVLREIVALQTGRPRPAMSTLFGPELRVVDTELAPPADTAAHLPLLGARPVRQGWLSRTVPGQPAAALAGGTAITAPLDAGACGLALPVPRVDPGDPNAGFLAALISTGPTELLGTLANAPTQSVETRLHELRALLEVGDPVGAARTLATLEEEYPDDWRVIWSRGQWALHEGDHETAALAFDAVYDAFPGESAPKLALAVCAEVLGQLDNAAEYYRLVWTTDQAYVSAAFGLARVRLAAGDRASAVAALESVPESSSHYIAARIAAVRARLRGRSPSDPLLEDLRAAAGQVERLGGLGIDAVRRETLVTEVLGSALDWVLAGRHGAAPGTVPDTTLLGNRVEERELRFGLERSYRVLARLAQRGEERINMVECANRLRPRTWV